MGRAVPETSTASALPSAKDDRSEKILALAKQLFALLADGFAGPLRYSIKRGPAIWDAKLRAYDKSSYTTEWRAAQELLATGQLRNRAANPYTLLQHLLGRYDVALQSPSWARTLVIDIDRPAVSELPLSPSPLRDGEDLVELQLEQTRADNKRDETLSRVWAALRFDETPDRQPIVLQTPGGGYHLYLPLDRHWPLAQARQVLEHHLHRHSLGVRPGVLEIYPSGVPLRVPCGRGMALLKPQHPTDCDALDLTLLHARWVVSTDPKKGYRTAQLRRDVLPMVEDFLATMELQRRPLEQWLDPDATAPLYDPTWGPWLRRISTPACGDAEKHTNQHIEDVLVLASSGPGSPSGRGGRLHGVVPAPGPGSSALSKSDSPPTYGGPPGAGRPADLGGDARPKGRLMTGGLLHGAEWWATLARLLSCGIQSEGLRHDSALKVAWYFRVVEGLDAAGSLSQVEVWLRSLPHKSSTSRAKGQPAFLKTTLREVKHYLEAHLTDISPRRASSGDPVRRGRIVLSPADHEMLERELPPELRVAGRALLSFLVPYADENGRIAGPVRLSAKILETLCGQARSKDPTSGKRRLANVLIEHFERLGILVRHRNHSAGRFAREYTVWYTFGAALLPARDEARGLVLGRRQVEEGELVVLKTEKPDARLSVQILLNGDVQDLPNAWWRRMYQRRAFTPGEFFEADQRHVLPGPFRDRWPEQKTSAPEKADNAPLSEDTKAIQNDAPTESTVDGEPAIDEKPPATEQLDADLAQGSTPAPALPCPALPSLGAEQSDDGTQNFPDAEEQLGDGSSPDRPVATERPQPLAEELMLQLHRKRLSLGYPCGCDLFCKRLGPGP